MLRISNRRNVFAEIIKADQHSLVVAGFCRGQCFAQILTSHKTVRHAPRCRIRSDPIGDLFAFGKLEERRTDHTRLLWINDYAWEAPCAWLCPSRNFSASMAALQPDPAAVTA